MSRKNNQENRPKDLAEQLEAKLNEAYFMAEQHFFLEKKPEVPSYVKENLSTDFIAALESAAIKCEKASTGYLNIITGLTIKAAYPNIE